MIPTHQRIESIKESREVYVDWLTSGSRRENVCSKPRAFNEKTRRAYKIDVSEFSQFLGMKQPQEFRTVTRAHVIAWRETLERREMSAPTIRRKLSALSSLFEYLCERNAVAGNPVDGVKRPMVNSNEGSTPALSDAQTRRLLEAPPEETVKGIRDRAILATLLYHGRRRVSARGAQVAL